MKRRPKSLHLILICLISLSACRMPAPSSPSTTQINPEALFTAAALTAEAMRAAELPGTSTATSAILDLDTPSPFPTDTPTPTGPVVATVVLSTPAPEGASGDIAEFVEDVTVPDGMTFAPHQAFTKTWRIKNTGTTTWTTEYKLVFVRGALMRAPASIPLPREVPPGETVDLSVDMVAPAQDGIYQSFWLLRNASGQTFGVGLAAMDPIWVTIAVSSALAPLATTTPTSVRVVSALNLVLDHSLYTGACPHIFRLKVEFEVRSPTTVSFYLEGGTSQGREINLQPPFTRTLDVGTQIVEFEITFTESLEAWLRLVFTQPEAQVSDEVHLILTCE